MSLKYGSKPDLRVEKTPTEAVVTLSNGQSNRGWFFVSGGSAKRAGQERIGDLLNGEAGFVPFQINESGQARTVLYHRTHLVTVALGANAEARLDPGYAVARAREVSLLLSTGRRLVGIVRVHRPDPQNRLSDWARSPEMFRYLETPDGTVLVNTLYIIEAHEIPDYE